MASKRRRLSRSGEFDRVYRDGSSHATRYLVLYSFPAPRRASERDVRLGVSASRKVGGAVERNRAKRAPARGLLEPLRAASRASHDFVLVARPEIGGLIEREGTAAVRKSIEEALAGAFQRAAFHVKRVAPRPDPRLPALDLPGPPAPLPLRADLLGLCPRGDRALRRAPGPAARRLAPAALQPLQPRRL